MKSTDKIILALFMVVSLSACSLLKKAETVKSRVEQSRKEKILKDLTSSNLTFNTLTGSFSVKYSDSENRHNFLGNLKLRKNQLIIIKLKLPLGFDLATLKINPDTIYVSSVLSGSETYTFEEIENIYGVKADFKLLENLLVGNFLIYPDTSYFNKLVLDSIRDNKAYLSYRTADPNNPALTLYKQEIVADLNKNKVEHYTIWDFSGETYEYYIDFGEFEQTGTQYIPRKIKFKFISNDTVNVEIKYKRISIK